jgi:hypothetical protein
MLRPQIVMDEMERSFVASERQGKLTHPAHRRIDDWIDSLKLGCKRQPALEPFRTSQVIHIDLTDAGVASLFLRDRVDGTEGRGDITRESGHDVRT